MTNLPTLRDALLTLSSVTDAASETLKIFLRDVESEADHYMEQRQVVRQRLTTIYAETLKFHDEETQQVTTAFAAWRQALSERIAAIEGPL